MNLYKYHTNPEILYGFHQAIKEEGIFDTDELIELGLTSEGARQALIQNNPRMPESFWTGYLPYVSDDLLKEILEDLKVLAHEHIVHVVMDWEAQDDYYHSFIHDEYADEDGEIDWDKVDDDGNSYDVWNDDIRAYYQVLDDTFSITREELIDVARLKNEEETWQYDGEFVPSIYDIINLEILIAFMLKDDLPEYGRNYDRYDHAKNLIAEYLEEKTIIKQVMTGKPGYKEPYVKNGQNMFKAVYHGSNKTPWQKYIDVSDYENK